MFWDILNASVNWGCYYGGVAFFTVLWVVIYTWFFYLFWRISGWLGKQIGIGLFILRDKLKREKDVQEKETEEQS